MLTLRVILKGDGAYPDLAEKAARGELIHVANGGTLGLSALDRGMASGRASVMFRVDLPDGRTVLGETSLRALLTATDALRAHYGDQD